MHYAKYRLVKINNSVEWPKGELNVACSKNQDSKILTIKLTRRNRNWYSVSGTERRCQGITITHVCGDSNSNIKWNNKLKQHFPTFKKWPKFIKQKYWSTIHVMIICHWYTLNPRIHIAQGIIFGNTWLQYADANAGYPDAGPHAT